MQFRLYSFESLSAHELYELLKLRSKVFVVEQSCLYLDMDDKDQAALHLLGYDGNELIAYSRLLPQGVYFPEACIGRVVVDPDQRKKEAGKALMKEAIKLTLDQFKTNEIVISAQLYLERFYTELGFVKESEVYLEDDIPHIKMRFVKP